jgi:hypothetical protein
LELAQSEIIHLLDSFADFAGGSTVGQLCLASCYEEKNVPNKHSRRPRTDERSDPSMELLGSQPSTQGGSQPIHEASLSICDDIPEDDTTFLFGNQSEFNYPRLLSLNRFIEATPVDVVDRNPGKTIYKNGKIVQVLQFASKAESRKPTAKKKKLENFQIVQKSHV